MYCDKSDCDEWRQKTSRKKKTRGKGRNINARSASTAEGGGQAGALMQRPSPPRGSSEDIRFSGRRFVFLVRRSSFERTTRKKHRPHDYSATMPALGRISIAHATFHGYLYRSRIRKTIAARRRRESADERDRMHLENPHPKWRHTSKLASCAR